MNAHVDKLRETSTKYAPGWNLDNINHINQNSKYHRSCPAGNSWYGWSDVDPVLMLVHLVQIVPNYLSDASNIFNFTLEVNEKHFTLFSS